MSRPATCVGCGVPLRSSAETLADHPGSRQYAAKGLCATCYGHKKGKRRKRVVPTTCVGCGVGIFPPGTGRRPTATSKPHGAHGLCVSCYRKSRR